MCYLFYLLLVSLVSCCSVISHGVFVILKSDCISRVTNVLVMVVMITRPVCYESAVSDLFIWLAFF